MAFEVSVLQTASLELYNAIGWYETQQEGLGEKLYDDFFECFEKLKSNPQHYGYLYKEYRQVLLKKFPFKIIFLILEDKVIIYSIFHTSRNVSNLYKRL